jgi:NAD(P)H-nitrite reductase large subunit
VEVDALAVGFGFRPSTELVRLLGCAMSDGGDGSDPLPVRDEWGRTSLPGVYVAGEAAGVAGVHAAAARGTLAAAAAARDLRLRPLASHLERRAARRARSTERFAALNASLFPPPADRVAALPDDTVVCRCEAVTAGQVRCAVSTGWNERNSTKGATRAGMGPCQGRECGFAVSTLVRQAGGLPGAPFPARQPIKPVPVSVAMGSLDQELGQ